MKYIFVIALAILATTLKVASGAPRPPYSEYAKRARYMVHRANSTVLATFSSHDPTIGYPYARLESIADGPPSGGKGTPYFYLMEQGTPADNFNKINNVTLTFSEAQFGDIASCAITPQSDPENPVCARLMMYGNMRVVTDSAELKYAMDALFTRHPFMKAYPPGHNFHVYAIDFTRIEIMDYYGGAVPITSDAYYKA